MMKKLFLILTLIVLCLAGPTTPALAKGLQDDKVVAGGEYTLTDGDTLNGNLVVLGGSVVLEEGSLVDGSVVIVGGSSELAGEVAGDVVVFGGSVNLLETVVIEGDLVRSGGSIDAEEGYEVQGNETQSIPDSSAFPFIADNPAEVPTPTPVTAVQDGVEGLLRELLRIMWAFISAFMLALFAGLLAMVVVALMPEPLTRVTAAMTQAPVVSGGLGLLTLIAVPVLAVLVMVITLFCFTPVSFVAMLVYVVAIFLGWLALGALLGERIVGAFKSQTISPVLAAGIGTFLLTWFVNLFNVWPGVGEFFGSITSVLLAAFGLGAVVLTRFGLRPYLANVAPASVQPAPPPPAAEA
jgi:hypothetical protein